MSKPSDKTLEKELRLEAQAMLAKGIEVTVNKVRARVEEKLDLAEAYFKEAPQWKERSKQIIHKAIVGEESDDEPTKEVKPVKKSAVKRQSSEEPEQKPKRVKKEPAPKKLVKKIAPIKNKKKPILSESELSDLSGSEEEKPKKRNRKATKAESQSHLSDHSSGEEENIKPRKTTGRGRLKKKLAQSDDDDGDNIKTEPDARSKKRSKIESEEDEPAKKKQVVANSSDDESKDKGNSVDVSKDDQIVVIPMKDEDSKMAVDDDSSELSSVIDDAPPPNKQKAKKEESKAAIDDDSSELSSVIDDEQPKRRKSKDAKGSSKKALKASSSKATPKETTGDEAEIKKLQGQLLKCGIRKIWGIELKEHGDDSRAKIRHLKKMLAEAGITGRFSEAKAKEIKERRELLADLGAVQEMNDLWGAGGRGGRSSRSKAKVTTKEVSEEESEGENTKTRVSKRMADLAFLGSESEGDSD